MVSNTGLLILQDLRETTDIIEALGIKKTHEKINQASVILLIDEISDSAESINKRAQSIREMIRESEKHLDYSDQ